MVVEVTEITIAAGREDDALRYCGENRRVFDNCARIHNYSFGLGVEHPSKLMMVIAWDSVEAHYEEVKEPEFVRFGQGLAAFMTGAKIEHFVPSVSSGD